MRRYVCTEILVPECYVKYLKTNSFDELTTKTRDVVLYKVKYVFHMQQNARCLQQVKFAFQRDDLYFVLNYWDCSSQIEKSLHMQQIRISSTRTQHKTTSSAASGVML